MEKGNFHSRIWSLVSGQKNAKRGLVPNIARRCARVIPEPKKISHRAGPVIAEPVSCAIISRRNGDGNELYQGRFAETPDRPVNGNGA